MSSVFTLLALLGIAASPPVLSQSVTVWVTNPASNQLGMPRGGALASIYLSRLNGKPGLYTAPPAGPLPFRLADVQVIVNGALAPILAVYIPAPGETSRAQVNIQVPMERNATLNTDGSEDFLTPTVLQSGVAIVAMAFYDPTSLTARVGGFFQDEKGYVIAEHASDHSRVTVENPAQAGETITAYGNDLFSVWPPPPIGIEVPAEPRFEFSDELTASLSGLNKRYLYLQEYPLTSPFLALAPALKVLFQGLALGRIGVQRVDFVVPSDQAPGDWPLFYNVGSCPNGQAEGCATGQVRSSAYALLPVR
jgi:uncharacterized protein (TIGR03437 family)